MTTKICSKCGIEYPATNEFFKIDKRKPLGLAYQCKRCDKKYRESRKEYFIRKKHEHYLNNKEKYNQRNKKRKEKAMKQTDSNLNYTTIHDYIRRIKKKQTFCMICNQPKRLELASIDHTYTENPDDYLWLCRSCHSIFDKLRSEVLINE